MRKELMFSFFKIPSIEWMDYVASRFHFATSFQDLFREDLRLPSPWIFLFVCRIQLWIRCIETSDTYDDETSERIWLMK